MSPAIALFLVVWLAAAPAFAQTASRDEPARASMPSVSEADRRFLQLAIDNGAKEVQLSQHALQRAQDAEIRQLAQRIVDEHSAVNRELMSLTETLLGERGPPFKKASRRLKRETEGLKTLEGTAFEERYLDIMVRDHRAALELYENEAKRGHHPEIKALAQKTVPMLEQHLKLAQEISRKNSRIDWHGRG